MLSANRLSRSAYNMALKGWVSVQICPARAVCQNPIEKTLGNPYFFGVSRFPEHSCDLHGVSPALTDAWSRWCRPRVQNHPTHFSKTGWASGKLPWWKSPEAF